MADQTTQRIAVEPKVMAGKPVIRGTRIPVELIIRMLAQGVSEALVCTAAGLLVGIMAFSAYAIFRTRAGRLTADLEAATTQFFATFTMTYAPSRTSARRELRDPMMLEEDI